MVVVCLLGLALCQRHRLWRREMLYPALLVLGIWGAHTLVVTEMRHRWTVEPVMLLFMAPALTHFARHCLTLAVTRAEPTGTR